MADHILPWARLAPRAFPPSIRSRPSSTVGTFHGHIRYGRREAVPVVGRRNVVVVWPTRPPNVVGWSG